MDCHFSDDNVGAGADTGANTGGDTGATSMVLYLRLYDLKNYESFI